MALRGYDKVLEVETSGSEHSRTYNFFRRKLFGRLLTSVNDFYGDFKDSSGRSKEVSTLLPFLMTTPEQTTAIILSWMVGYPYSYNSEPSNGMIATKQIMIIGKALLDNANFNRALKSTETGKLFRWLINESSKSRAIKFRLKAMYRDWRAETDVEDILKIGAQGLDLAVKAFPEYLEYVDKNEFVNGRPHRKRLIVKTQAWWDIFQAAAEKVALAHPMCLPTIIPPKPWKVDQGFELSNGGYYFISKPMVRNVSKSVKHVFKLSTTSMDALNHAQATAWELNQRVLNVAKGLLDKGILSPAIPQLPEKPTEEEIGKFSEFQRIIGAAEDVADKATIYFPKSYDWRLRMYDLPNDLRPQGSDFARGMLRFKQGHAPTLNGRKWLKVHLGNLMGFDKATYDQRCSATDDATDLIQRTVSDPLKNLEWTEMEDPWQFLAACFDWVEVESSDKALSHIPVSLDGTCSGMQHFSMLTRDYKGALATNCTASDRVNDLYLAVAERVKARVEFDAARGEKLALLWWDKIQDKATARKTVKRAVMTVPYGVTDRGITAFMIKDKHVDSFPKEDRWKAAIYMTTMIRAALDDTMSNARSAQAYMNTVAYTLALKQKPLAWRTPAGSVIAQGYKKLIDKRVVTPSGRLVLTVEADDAEFDSRRARLATSPNVIHSLDAAHLQMVVSGLKAEGISDMFLVHDSFGVHACNVENMRDILRLKLFKIYQNDALEQWKLSVEELSGEKLPPPPALGDWDISEVLKAEYLFA